jgi:ribosome biogenesis GTPase
VIAEHREIYRVHTGADELAARVAGRLRHTVESPADLPAVGDWVVIEHEGTDSEAVIHAVLPRATYFSRKVAGTRTDEQVVAANVDSVWIVSDFGYDLNPARIDRYVTLVWQGGATPIIILTKADLADDPDPIVAELQSRAIGVPIHTVSSVTGAGLEELKAYLSPGHTIALLGSSGVGKSTLLNRLLAGREVMATTEVRARQGKGRHKTTHRQLVLLPSGALLLDTPGMRELQLWDAEEGIEQSFEDIESIGADCRFSDCSHESEPGCAVRAAVDDGRLPPERLASYHKLRKEAAYISRKREARSNFNAKRRWKSITKEWRRRTKDKT